MRQELEGLLQCQEDVLRRVLRIALGFAMLAAGLLLSLPGVPGPGLLIALGGLVVLSEHFRWARGAVGWLKRTAARARKRVGQRRDSRGV